jgi:hypothetical protein
MFSENDIIEISQQPNYVSTLTLRKRNIGRKRIHKRLLGRSNVGNDIFNGLTLCLVISEHISSAQWIFPVMYFHFGIIAIMNVEFDLCQKYGD